MLRHALAGALALACTPALADNAPSRCVDLAVPRGIVEAHGGKWVQLTPEQFQFMRGVYVLNPQTPPGLPYGDRAVLARVEGAGGGMIFFIDGDKACGGMPVPHQLLEMMRDVGEGKIPHEGSAS